MELKRIISANEKITIGYDDFDQLIRIERKQYSNGKEYTEGAFVWDIRGMTCCICKRVWTDDPNEWEYEKVENGRWEEKAGLDGKHKRLKDPVFAHPACYLGHLNINERNMIARIVRKCRRHLNAHIPYEIDAIPDQYKGGAGTDWYIVSLLESKPFSKIKFGSRRRVWVIELFSDEEIVVPKTYPGVHPVDGLIQFEDVTKFVEPKRIQFHAHSEEKVEQYVEALLRLVVKPDMPPPTTGSGFSGALGVVG